MLVRNEAVVARPKESRFLSCTADGKKLEGKHLQHRFVGTEHVENNTEEGYFASLPTDLFDDDDGEDAAGKDKEEGNTDFFFNENSMIVSPGNSRTTWRNSVQEELSSSMLWKEVDASFNIDHTNKGQHLLSKLQPSPLLLPTTPTTPVNGAARGSALYGSFAATASTTMMTINSPSHSESMNMWQYEEAAVLSPRTTDAVAFSSSSPSSSFQLLQQQQDDQKRNQWAAMRIPIAPALRNYEGPNTATIGYPGTLQPAAAELPMTAIVNRVAAANTTPAQNYGNGVLPPFPPLMHQASSPYEEPSIPATIAFVKRLPPLEFDVDDDVSLLADDPDDDDAQVLPMATYDVLAETGIFADDDDDNEEG